mmetsp:Transcript_23028/g.73710  ORF Transcript_23028/g.73710 Transcript_23028/m.73710 type:complete len:222 (-) Transcript_23028:2-667(-)
MAQRHSTREQRQVRHALPPLLGRWLRGRRHGARSRDDVIEGLEQNLHAQDARRVGWSVMLSKLELVEPVQVVDRVAGDLAKDGVLVVKPLAPVEREEELRLVGVGAAARHPEQAAVCEANALVRLVLELATLVLVLGRQRALAALARACRVAGLRHEVLNHAVEDAAIVVALHAELHEVAARERRLFAPQLDIERPEARVQDDLAAGRRLVGVDGERRHSK